MTSAGRRRSATTPSSLAELRQLARLKQPLVRLRGQWVELHHEDLAAAITAVGKRGATAERLSAGEVLRIAIGLEQTPGWPPGGARWRRTDGSGICWPGPTTGSSRPSRRRRGSPASCARIRSVGSDGSPSSATSASAPAWPTTWVSARRPSSSPLLVDERTRSRQTAPNAAGGDLRGRHEAAAGRAETGPDAGALPDVPGRQLATRGCPFRPEAVGLRPPRPGPARRQGVHSPCRHGGPGAVDLRPGRP